MAAATEAEAVATFPFCAAPTAEVAYAAPAPDIKERPALGLYDDDDGGGGGDDDDTVAFCACAWADQLAPECVGEEEADVDAGQVVPFEYI
jgi:hypothetical protein